MVTTRAHTGIENISDGSTSQIWKKSVHGAELLATGKIEVAAHVNVMIRWVHEFTDIFTEFFGANTNHITSNIGRTLVGHEIVDHSDVNGASPVGAAPITSSFSA